MKTAILLRKGLIEKEPKIIDFWLIIGGERGIRILAFGLGQGRL